MGVADIYRETQELAADGARRTSLRSLGEATLPEAPGISNNTKQ